MAIYITAYTMCQCVCTDHELVVDVNIIIIIEYCGDWRVVCVLCSPEQWAGLGIA